MAMAPALSALGKSTHDRISPVAVVYNAQESRAEMPPTPERPESFAGASASCTSSSWELVKLAKHRKWFSLAARDVAGRQCIFVALKINTSCC